jgi:hypothetical protein
MKHITTISMKNRCKQILILCVCAFSLISCYDVDPLPDRIRSGYSFAIPLVDTTVSVGDFASFTQYEELLGQDSIPANTLIQMGEQDYPFYIGDYSSSQTIKWVEPHINITPEDLPSGTKVNIRIYIKKDTDEQSYFWLPADYSVSLTNTSIKVPESPQRIENISEFRDARKVFLDMYLTFPEKEPVVKIIKYKVNVKFAIQFAMETNLSITL